jgi:hypothetical protein
MEEPTIREILKLVGFERNPLGVLRIKTVKDDVLGNIYGNVFGDVRGNVKGDVWNCVEGSVGDCVGGNVGNVLGDVGGYVKGSVNGTINGRQWQFVETPKEKAIRLIREGKSEEAIKVLEESE